MLSLKSHAPPIARRGLTGWRLAQLRDPSLLKTNVCYVNGEWVPAKSGKTFEVTGREPTSTQLAISEAGWPCANIGAGLRSLHGRGHRDCAGMRRPGRRGGHQGGRGGL